MTKDLTQQGLGASVYTFSLTENQILPQSLEPAHVRHDVTDDVIRQMSPAVPVPILRPGRLTQRAKDFIKAFTGNVMYAVKCNPDEIFLKAMHKGGVRRFDVASISEVR